MTDTHKISIIEAANLSGIPVEEIHSRVFRGDLPGDGNLAMPGNRAAGFVNAGTLERLISEGRGRTITGTLNPTLGIRFHVYMTLPIAQAALELDMTVREVEALLVAQKLEGSFCHPHWVGVKHGSLAAFQERRKSGPYLVAPDAPTQNTGTAIPPAPVSRFRAVLQALTGGTQS